MSYTTVTTTYGRMGIVLVAIATLASCRQDAVGRDRTAESKAAAPPVVAPRTTQALPAAAVVQTPISTPTPNPQTRSQPQQQKVTVFLRSSPPGALTLVNGIPVGDTPYAHEVRAGREHEFSFALEGYRLARYRLRVLQQGAVHARLVSLGKTEASTE